MGLLDWLFRKQAAPVSSETEKMVEQPDVGKLVTEIIDKQPTHTQEANFAVRTATERVEHEPVGELSCLDFGKPEGELGRFLNYRKYSVTGIDEQGKKKMKHRTGVDAKQAIEKAANEGLLPPFKAEPLDYFPPSDQQLNYLKDLGVFIPDEITNIDASYMISRAIGEDSMEGPTPSIVALATGLKTEFSAFVGASGLLQAIIVQASDRDRAALYAYGVRQSLRGRSFRNMLEDSELPVFYVFADQVLSDPALFRSLKGRPAEDFKSPHRGTAIYKAAVAHLTGGGVYVG